MLDQKINFCCKFAIKTLRSTVANTDIRSLKSLHTFLKKCLYHVLVKFKQNRMVQTTQNVDVEFSFFFFFFFKLGFFITILTKSWHHFGRCFCSWNYCLMLNCQFKGNHFLVFQNLWHADTCNQVKSYNKHGRPNQSRQELAVALNLISCKMQHFKSLILFFTGHHRKDKLGIYTQGSFSGNHFVK